MKIISIEEYRNLEEDRRKMKETEENFRKVETAMDSMGNDVGKYASSQLKEGNPDTMVRNDVMSEGERIMAENENEGLDGRIDGISNLLLMSAQALKGLKVDHTLNVDVLEMESITKKRLSFKVSDVIKCILDKKKMTFLGSEIEPLKIIEGFIAGVLIFSRGQFYRHDYFVHAGQRLNPAVTLNIRSSETIPPVQISPLPLYGMDIDNALKF